MSSDQSEGESSAKKELLFKILVIGDVGTGKSSIIRRYVHNVFEQHYKLTIGVDFATKVIQWDADKLIRLQFWDISGAKRVYEELANLRNIKKKKEYRQERFGNMTRVYYKDAHGALVVFDCARRATFEGAQRWKHDLDNKVCLSNGRSVPAILIGNKCDLEMNVTDEELAEYARKNGFVGGFKTSARSNTLIDKSIQFLTEQMLETERDGQYGVPIYARDRNILRLYSEDEEKRMKKNSFFSCC